MNPKIRQSLYYAGSIIPAVVGIIAVWGGVDAGAADNINTILVGLLSLLGVVAPTTAAVNLKKQRKDDVFSSPADQVVNGVQRVIEAKQVAEKELARVQDAVTSVSQIIPELGPLAQQAVEAFSTQAWSAENAAREHLLPYDR